ncbi:MAG: hypothetical protein FWG48_01645 [Oscillospiraceae bacterium]|nr:hypothetical protein [Oscillospiraceae bacterium]
MFNRMFLERLEEQGHLNPQQVADALATQRSTKVRLGTLAIEAHMMTEEQAETINRQQAAQNAHFGELAVKNKFLSQAQLAYLLDIQPREHVVLKQILHDKQYMQAEAVEAELAAYRQELALSDRDFERLLDNHVNTYVSKIAAIDGWENPILTVYARIFLTTVIRLVDKDIAIRRASSVTDGSMPYAISISLKGDATNALVFSAGDVGGAIEFAGKFAEGFMGTTIDATDEIARDAMKEFLNCVGGLFTTELTSKTHLSLDIEVPQFSDNFAVESEVIALPFSCLTGDFTIFIH